MFLMLNMTPRIQILFIAAMMICLAPSAPMADDGTESAAEAKDENGRFQWSWEKNVDPDGDSAEVPEGAPAGTDIYEKIIQENTQLRRENANLKKLCDETQKINSDLFVKVQAAKEAPEAAKPDEDQSLGELMEQNLALTKENERLKAEVAARKTPAPVAAQVGPQSDLYKDEAKRSAELAKQNQVLKSEQKKIEDEKQQLVDKERLLSQAVEQQKQKVDTLEQKQKAMSSLVEFYRQKAQKLDDAEKELAVAKKELQSRDQPPVMAVKTAAKEESTGETQPAVQPAVQPATDKGGDRDKMDLLYNMGVLYAGSGMYKEAEKSFLDLIRTDPRAADAHYNLGVIYDEHLGDRKKAAQHYRTYLKLDPSGADAEKVKLWLLELEMR